MLWPEEEARRLIERNERLGIHKPILFQTGFGPSGLPHLATMGEVARTLWVKNTYEKLTGMPGLPLLVFSDDMDGFRRVPDNVPNKEMLEQYIGIPLTRVPDPFGTHASFGEHNNAMLCRFLDENGFDGAYSFASATTYYTSGAFNSTMRLVLEKYDEIMALILPTLGKDKNAQERNRASTYSPILPIHPITGQVMQVRIDKIDVEAGTIFWEDEGQIFETSVYDGHAKCQWKIDWAMRWATFGIDYEMSGKDLMESVKLSTKICRILGVEPPLTFTYEMFLDKDGQKISKSKGNGVSVDQWLRYGPSESLKLFMFNTPQRAKKLMIDAIPRITDEYIAFANNWEKGECFVENNPVWIINGYADNISTSPLPLTMLINLASAINATSADMLWGYIHTYNPTLIAKDFPLLDILVQNALNYYTDFVLPKKVFRAPTDMERAALVELASVLEDLPADASAEVIMTEVYAVGKNHHIAFTSLKDWFGCLYQVLLGQQEGPRFGAFVALYGRDNTVALIKEKLEA